MTTSRVVALARKWSEPADRTTAIFCVRDAAFLCVLFGYYLFYPHLGFERLIPDNIAQTAYWSLLTRPDLVGGVGSSSPKAGLILLLGSVHHPHQECDERHCPEDHDRIEQGKAIVAQPTPAQPHFRAREPLPSPEDQGKSD